MAVKIAHRGNYVGANLDRENTISYLREALDKDYWIECDIQTHNDLLYFGHDEPQERVDNHIISHPNTICHAKDLNALHTLLGIGVHCFWHEEDTVTLTSRGLIWCYPGVHPNYSNAIWLDLQNQNIPTDTTAIFGVCADNFTK